LEAKTFDAMSSTGNLVKLRLEKPDKNHSITIDLADNQIRGNGSLLIVPDDQNAVEVADTLLTGQWVA
jgi:ornithine carbamoyltransferase